MNPDPIKFNKQEPRTTTSTQDILNQLGVMLNHNSREWPVLKRVLERKLASLEKLESMVTIEDRLSALENRMTQVEQELK